MQSISGIPENPFKLAYFVSTDIQHLPPIIRLFPYLGGIIIVENKEIYHYIQEKYSSLNIPRYYVKSRREAETILTKNKIRTVIYPGYHILYWGNSIQIFHGGLSDKNYVESVKIIMYDLVLFPGQKTVDKVDKSGYLKDITHWKLIGYPKFDPLISRTIKFDPIFKNGRKTILYAPTWVSKNENFKIIKFSEHGESSLEIWSLDIIKELCADYNIIIKYHSRIYREENDIYEQIDNLIKSLGVEDKVITRRDDNILPYMAEADLMISDISTACYEWFHFDKPIVFANPSPAHYAPSNDISSNTYAWQAGDVINTSDQIYKFVKANLETDKYKEVRNSIFNYTIYKPDGHATERQVEAITTFCRASETTPYLWHMIKTWSRRRISRTKVKILNRYYRYFKTAKQGR